MKTIVEPRVNIIRLWGNQRIHEEAVYRLMTYVLRENYNGYVLLHNVVTGQLVVIDDEEAAILDNLPLTYSRVMEPLIVGHFLVPLDYNEFEQVLNLRIVLRKLDEVHADTGIIQHYTILPTTACNARCYYCFEQGVKSVTMSKDTADDVVKFIKSHCGGKNVLLSWFGGEPTIVDERIDQICRGLQIEGVKYSSKITTNGYLLNEEMSEKAKYLWRLYSAMICVDGTEKNYNRIKRFVYDSKNAYDVVMHNVGSLLAKGIKVHLRMNFDIGNYNDFPELVNEARQRFNSYDNLVVTAHPVIGDYTDFTGHVRHGSPVWFENKICELNDIADDAGLQHRDNSLPWLKHRTCMAASDSSVTITAEGNLVSCPEQFGDDQWKGNLREGITNTGLVDEWKQAIVYDKCKECASFPDCVVTMNCLSAGNCLSRESIVRIQKMTMTERYKHYITSNN